MWYQRVLSAISISLLVSNSYGQSKDSTSEFKISGYADAYYAHYSDSVGVNQFQKIAAVSPRSNEFGLNILQLTAQYTSPNIRAIGTLHYGDLPTSAWSPVYNYIQEANVGIRLKKNIWLDAGFFKTHIGTEALLPKDNIVSSLSVITVYEPWFQSGVKLSYVPNDKFTFCLHILNGYNTFVETNSKKSVGITLSYVINPKASIGYYNLIGDEMPDRTKGSHVRFLNNVVFNYQITSKLKTVIGVDYIGQQNSGITDNTKFASIYSAIAILQYQVNPKFYYYGRYEMYSDKDGFLSGVIALDTAQRNLTGYSCNGFTLGASYKPTENSYIKVEARDLIFDDKQNLFYTDGKRTNNRYEAMIHIGVWF
ncbi:MAG: outer membrane beta-barrel protein [Bacteroidota bacterium]